MSWIQMDSNLRTAPKVRAMSHILGIDIDAVVGKLHAIWAWFDAETEDGFMPLMGSMDIDDVARQQRFADAMQTVGWLEVTIDGARIPKFQMHMGWSAKKRAVDCRRQAKQRSKNVSRTQRDKSVTREDQRRSESEEPEPALKKIKPFGQEPIDEGAETAVLSCASAGAGTADAERPRQKPKREFATTAADYIEFDRALRANSPTMGLVELRKCPPDLQIAILFERFRLGDDSFRGYLAAVARRDREIAEDVIRAVIELRTLKPKNSGGFVRKRLEAAGWNL